MPDWGNILKSFQGSFTEPPIIQANNVQALNGAGLVSPDALSLKDYAALQGNRFIGVRDTNDIVDVSLANIGRLNRYLEYERLRTMVEVETALTIYANETCLAGSTKVITPFGEIRIDDLAKKHPDPDEEFLVYVYNFKKQDFDLGWAYNPRFVKRVPTVQVVLSYGNYIICTPEHKILLRDATWKCAGDLEPDDEIMLMNRVSPSRLKKRPENRFYRIRTLKSGWQTEKIMAAQYQHNGLSEDMMLEYVVAKGYSNEIPLKEISNYTDYTINQLTYATKNGLTVTDARKLNSQYPDRLKVLNVSRDKTRDVYDLSVKTHENFATTCGIVHNCQTNEDGYCFDILGSNKDAVKICNKLCHEELELDDQQWNSHRNLCLYGDEFLELIIDPSSPKDGILRVQSLPASTMYRIDTITGKLLEFQQSGVGADTSVFTHPEGKSSTGAIRFTPQQIIHMRLGGDRRMFYPYGESILEVGKGAAHQLRLMEDAMTVYRLTRSIVRRVFYIDVDQLPPAKIETLIERTRDQFRKKKVFNSRSASGLNASGIEEKWNPMSFDEDIWLPIRPGSGTRIDSMQEGAQWDQISDIVYFRNKLYMSLGLPKSYLIDDPSLGRTNLSAQDMNFAKRIERHQMVQANGLRQLCKRHLELIGFPYYAYKDLRVKYNPSSYYRDIMNNDVLEARYNRAAAVKGAQLMSDYDILVEILHVKEEKAKELVSRLEMQKISEARLQAMVQNPKFLGIAEAETSQNEMGTEAGGPVPEMNPESENMGEPQQNIEQGPQQNNQVSLLPEPSEDDIDKYNMGIRNYARERDSEDIDLSEL